jgi:phosphoribosylpyrophosphate synthetase
MISQMVQIQSGATESDHFQIAVLMNIVAHKKRKTYGILVVKCYFMYARKRYLKIILKII